VPQGVGVQVPPSAQRRPSEPEPRGERGGVEGRPSLFLGDRESDPPAGWAASGVHCLRAVKTRAVKIPSTPDPLSSPGPPYRAWRKGPSSAQPIARVEASLPLPSSGHTQGAHPGCTRRVPEWVQGASPSTPFALYAASGAPRGQGATPFGAPEGVRAAHRSDARKGEGAKRRARGSASTPFALYRAPRAAHRKRCRPPRAP